MQMDSFHFVLQLFPFAAIDLIVANLASDAVFRS
jgi:hypothetical protein